MSKLIILFCLSFPASTFDEVNVNNNHNRNDRRYDYLRAGLPKKNYVFSNNIYGNNYTNKNDNILMKIGSRHENRYHFNFNKY